MKQNPTNESTRSTKPRPPIFRALGKREPPEQIEIAGQLYHRLKIYKHDSWAATSLYQGPGQKQMVCKFNREQSLFGFPMKWLGRWLARRETGMLERLADVELIPEKCGDVRVDGELRRSVSGHEFIPGSPLGPDSHVSDTFFDEYRHLLEQLHSGLLVVFP